jgi:plasmid stabilization system protein ParE
MRSEFLGALVPYRTAPEVEADLDEIWRYVAVESRSLKTADKLIDAITRRFLYLARYPKMGRNRDADLHIRLTKLRCRKLRHHLPL